MVYCIKCKNIEVILRIFKISNTINLVSAPFLENLRKELQSFKTLIKFTLLSVVRSEYKNLAAFLKR